MNLRKKGFTLVELLVVIAVIALLVGILMPALNEVMKRAHVAETKATINAISIGLETFRNDFDKYPSSILESGLQIADVPTNNYLDCGAHHLAEAMFGIDQLGYSSSEIFAGAGYGWYQVNTVKGPCIPGASGPIAIQRHGPYVNLSNIKIGTMTDVPVPEGYSLSAAEKKVWTDNPNPVILDTINNRTPRPILYYKANTNGMRLSSYDRTDNLAIYYYEDNDAVTTPFGMNQGGIYPNYDSSIGFKSFANFLWDTKTGFNTIKNPAARPYNQDTFVLLSAGTDGEFGTEDDITNFNRRD